MPTFAYKAIGPDGDRLTGTLECDDRRQVIQKLIAQKFKPIAITARYQRLESTDQAGENIDFYKSSKAHSGKAKGLSGLYSKSKLGLSFLQKLLELLSSGLPMGDAVKLMSIRLSDPRLKELANIHWRNLSEGRTLAASLGTLPEFFSDSTVHLVEAGEASGNLVPILEKIVAYLEETAELRSRVLSSLAYPAFICVVAFGVVAFFLLFLLPKIKTMMETLGGEMQFFAKLLITGSDLFVKVGPFAGLGALFLTIGILQWRKTPSGKTQTDLWLLKLPFVGKIFLYSEIFRTSSLVSTLMDSGINTTETLRLCEKTIQNTQMRSKFTASRLLVHEGVSLASAFERNHYLPDLAIDILTVGENTGNIVRSLNEVTKIYRKELTQILRLMTAVVSSGALIFAFVLVTLIALSIVFSVFQISNTLTV